MKNKNNGSRYILFVMTVGLLMMLASYICSTIVFKNLLNTNNLIAVSLFIISLASSIILPGILVARFIFKRIELGKGVADTGIFVTSAIFYGAFGFFPALMESFANQLQTEQLTEIVGVYWTIFGITAGLYILIIGWIVVIAKTKDDGLITNFYISLVPLLLNVILNSSSTLHLFIFGSKTLEWANTFVYASLVFTCLSVIYYSIVSIILSSRVISKNLENSKEIFEK